MPESPLVALRARLQEIAVQASEDQKDIKDPKAIEDLEIAKDLFQKMIDRLDSRLGGRPNEHS